MENAKKFFEEVIRTEEAKTAFAELKKPENEEETINSYAEVAAKLGIELSEDEIKAYFAEKNAPGEIDDEELFQLTGGGENTACKDTYKHKENCWFNDGCDIAFNSYDDYLCKRSYYIMWYGKLEKRCMSNYFTEKYCTLNHTTEN